MDEETVVVLAEGAWCESCQFLEQREDVQPGGCISCGCVAENHVPVKVVKQ